MRQSVPLPPGFCTVVASTARMRRPRRKAGAPWRCRTPSASQRSQDSEAPEPPEEVDGGDRTPAGLPRVSGSLSKGAAPGEVRQEHPEQDAGVGDVTGAPESAGAASLLPPPRRQEPADQPPVVQFARVFIVVHPLYRSPAPEAVNA